MHAAVEFVRQGLVDHAMAVDPALPFEGPRHDMDAEMRFAAGPVAGMALVQVRFVGDVEAFGVKASVNFFVIVCRVVLGALVMIGGIPLVVRGGR